MDESRTLCPGRDQIVGRCVGPPPQVPGPTTKVRRAIASSLVAFHRILLMADLATAFNPFGNVLEPQLLWRGTLATPRDSDSSRTTPSRVQNLLLNKWLPN